MARVRLFGLSIDSDQPMPGPPTGRPADIVVRSREARADQAFADYETRIDGERNIDIQADGIRYLVSGGKRIDVDYPTGTEPGLVSAWLTGVALGAILVQRGLLPLHANAVVLPDGKGIAAFAGPSGAGKSTLATQMVAAGYDLFADDLLGVSFEGGAPLIVRGIPRLRLWGDTLDRLGMNVDGREPIVSGVDKYEVALDHSVAGPDRLPLGRLYILDRAEEADAPIIERLFGAKAGRAVLDNVYRWRVASDWHEDEHWAFARCLDIARQAEIYRVARPWSLDRVEEVFAAIDAHLRTAR